MRMKCHEWYKYCLYGYTMYIKAYTVLLLAVVLIHLFLQKVLSSQSSSMISLTKFLYTYLYLYHKIYKIYKICGCWFVIIYIRKIIRNIKNLQLLISNEWSLRGRINGQKGGNSILVKHEKLQFQIYFVETFTKMITFHIFKTNKWHIWWSFF